MAPLIRLALVASLFFATPAHADDVTRWRPLIEQASARFGVPTSWIERVMRAESGGRTTLNGRPIRSSKGAIGLMQLMPGTWADMRARLSLGTDPDDPRDNILAGTFYLRLMYERFGYPGLFAAYNTGPGRYAAYLAGRQRLPRETVGYLGAVGAVPPQPPRAISRPASAALFAVNRASVTLAAPPAEEPTTSSLFAIRRGTP